MSQRALWNSECEQSVLGCVLLSDEVFDDLTAHGLAEKHFFDKRHKIIFKAFVQLSERKVPLDFVALADFLESSGDVGNVGGREYISQLTYAVGSADNAINYAQIIMNYATERLFFTAAQDIMQVLLSPDDMDHAERIGRVQQVLLATDQHERVMSVTTLKESLKKMYEHIEDVQANPGIRGLCTGFQHIDYRLGGMQPGELHIWAGRPAMGKTAYALNIARHLAMVQKKNGLIFSLEMPTVQLVQRMTAAESKVNLGLLKSAKFVEMPEQSDKFGMGFTRLMHCPGELFFDDQGSLLITELVARAKRMHRKHKLDFIMVDHIGLVDSSLKTDNETLRLGQVSRALKKLARELKCTVIALSQVNRECDKRANKRPMMSDLRQSGSIEQDADVIQFLYRDEYYNENTDKPGQIEVITAKCRDGEAGTDYLSWQGSYNRVEGMDSAEQRYAQAKPVEDVA